MSASTACLLLATVGAPSVFFEDPGVAFRIPMGCEPAPAAVDGADWFRCGEALTLALRVGAEPLATLVEAERFAMETRAEGVMVTGPYSTPLAGGHEGELAELTGVRDGRVVLLTLTAVPGRDGEWIVARIETDYSPLETRHMRVQQQLVGSVWAGAERRTERSADGDAAPPEACRSRSRLTELVYKAPGERAPVKAPLEGFSVVETRSRSDQTAVYFGTRLWPLYDLALGAPPVGMRKADVLVSVVIEQPPVRGVVEAEHVKIDVVLPKTQAPIIPDAETSTIEVTHVDDRFVCGEVAVQDRMGNRLSAVFTARR